MKKMDLCGRNFEIFSFKDQTQETDFLKRKGYTLAYLNSPLAAGVMDAHMMKPFLCQACV